MKTKSATYIPTRSNFTVTSSLHSVETAPSAATLPIYNALIESDRKYKELFNTLPDVIMTTDLVGVIKVVNPACKAFFGYEPRELLGRTVADFYLCKQDRSAMIKEMMQNGFVQNRTIQFKDRAGALKTGSINARILYDEHRKEIGIDGIIRDVTDKVKSIEAINKAKVFYENILDSISADIALFDAENRYLFLNKKAIKNDVLRAWMIGKNDIEYCQEQGKDMSIAAARTQKHIEANTTKKPVEWIEELKDPDGNPVYQMRILKPFSTADGEDYKVGYGIDVTQLKQTQLQLAEKKSYLRSLLQSLPDTILRVNKEGTFIDCSTNHTHKIFAKPEEFLGKKMHEIWPAEVADFHLQQVQKALTSDQMITYEYPMILDEEQVFFEARVNKKTEDEVVVVVRDITERKEFEKRMFDAVVASEENERNRIAGELHDGLCQDLAAAKLTIEMAQLMAGDGNAQLAQTLEKSKKIIADSLDLARKVSHELVPKGLAERQLSAIIKSIINHLNQVDTIKYSLHVSGEEQTIAPHLSINLIRIVQEFIRNSQKHADTNRISIHVHFSPGCLQLSIEDYGKGIDQETLNNRDGIGILNMLKRIETIGGSYTMETAPQQGVQLSINVPL